MNHFSDKVNLIWDIADTPVIPSDTNILFFSSP